MYFIRKLEDVLEDNVSKQKNKLRTIDSRVFSYWSALYLSFFSRRLYVDVGKRWKGLGILYLLFVTALFSIPMYLQTSAKFIQNYKEHTIEPLLKIPAFYIQNGMVIFDKPMPYKIKDDTNQTLVIIDTTGKVNDFTSEYPNLSFLINKDKISFKAPALELSNLKQFEGISKNKPIVHFFGKESNLVFEGKQFIEQNGIYNLIYIAKVIIYPCIAAIYFSIFIVFFLVLALLGQTFSSIFFSFKVGFATSSRLLIVAGTPMLFLLMLILSLHMMFMGVGILLLSLLTIYYSFGIFALKAESKRVVTA